MILLHSIPHVLSLVISSKYSLDFQPPCFYCSVFHTAIRTIKDVVDVFRFLSSKCLSKGEEIGFLELYRPRF